MSTSAKELRFDDCTMWIELSDGRMPSVPLTWFPRLLNATPEQRAAYDIGQYGLRWEGLDENISIEGLLARREDMTQPNVGLIEERTLRQKTMKSVFDGGDWVTAETINAHQVSPPANKSLPASDWKRCGRIFSVTFDGREYFARYQFDEMYQPLPIIQDILQVTGEVADTWKIAAWFHCPIGWIADLFDGAKAVAPKDVLDRRDDVLAAARRKRESYEA
jgi:hypothetical protein